MSSNILFKKLQSDAKIPTRGTSASAGFDLYASDNYLIKGGDGVVLVHTGIAVRLPEETYGRIAMRSGLAIKQHLNVTAGVVDIDYKGELGVLIYCTKIGHEYRIRKGERIAQLIPEKISYALSEEVIDFPDNNYTDHIGYGSSGQF